MGCKCGYHVANTVEYGANSYSGHNLDVCLLCTTTHSTAHNSSDNLSSCPPFNCRCSDTAVGGEDIFSRQ